MENEMNDDELVKAAVTTILGWEFRPAGDKWDCDNYDTKPGFRHATGPMAPTLKEVAELVEEEMVKRGYRITIEITKNMTWVSLQNCGCDDKCACDIIMEQCKSKAHAFLMAALSAVEKE
jgi:hypothetical protein